MGKAILQCQSGITTIPETVTVIALALVPWAVKHRQLLIAVMPPKESRQMQPIAKAAILAITLSIQFGCQPSQERLDQCLWGDRLATPNVNKI